MTYYFNIYRKEVKFCNLPYAEAAFKKLFTKTFGNNKFQGDFRRNNECDQSPRSSRDKRTERRDDESNFNRHA